MLDVKKGDTVWVRTGTGWRTEQALTAGPRWITLSSPTLQGIRFNTEDGKSNTGYTYPYIETMAQREQNIERARMVEFIKDNVSGPYSQWPFETLRAIYAALAGTPREEWRAVRFAVGASGERKPVVVARGNEDFVLIQAALIAKQDRTEDATWVIEKVEVIELVLEGTEFVPGPLSEAVKAVTAG